MRSSLSMVAPKPSGFSNTKAGKAAILERTRKLVDSSYLIIAVPIDGVSKEQIDILRKELPSTGVRASVVKNSLLKLTVKNTPFEALASTIRDENMFFFIQEGAAKKSFDAYKKWQKEVKRTEPNFDPKFAAMEGLLYKTAQIESIVNLPTRLELITMIAKGIKAVPLKVARGVKAVPNKVGLAFSAVKNKMEEDAKVAAV